MGEPLRVSAPFEKRLRKIEINCARLRAAAAFASQK
jgi:hypothetical protein